MIYMKKYLICALLALALLSGCITNPPPQGSNNPVQYVPGNVSPEPEVNMSNLVNMSENETTSKVYLKAFSRGGEWFFPLQNYSGEFAEAGIYSSVFIKLNSSQLKTLGNDESLWITPYTSDGKGILFNAILSKEINRCNLSAVRLLGKYYTMDYLKTSPNFNNDDKWKLATVSENGCIKRVLIVQSGYFYDISEDESIPLFTNDGSLSAQFRNLGSAPELVISGLKPAPPVASEANALTNTTSYVQEFDVNLTSFEYWGNPGWRTPHHAKEAFNSSGFYVEFDSALPIIVNLSLVGYYDNASNSFKKWVVENGANIDESLEYDHAYDWPFVSLLPSFPVPGSGAESYVLTCMNYTDSNISKICMGKEISRKKSRPWEDPPFTLDSKTYRFVGFISSDLSPQKYGALFENYLTWQNCSAKSASLYSGDSGVLLERLYDDAARASGPPPEYFFACTKAATINFSNVALLCPGDSYPVSGTKKLFVSFIDTGFGLTGCFYSSVDFLYLDDEVNLENGKDGVILDWNTVNGIPALKSVFIPSTHPYHAQLLG